MVSMISNTKVLELSCPAQWLGATDGKGRMASGALSSTDLALLSQGGVSSSGVAVAEPFHPRTPFFLSRQLGASKLRGQGQVMGSRARKQLRGQGQGSKYKEAVNDCK